MDICWNALSRYIDIRNKNIFLSKLIAKMAKIEIQIFGRMS